MENTQLPNAVHISGNSKRKCNVSDGNLFVGMTFALISILLLLFFNFEFTLISLLVFFFPFFLLPILTTKVKSKNKKLLK